MTQFAERFLTIITGAAIMGLIIINAKGTAAVLGAAKSFTTGYVNAVQGSGGPTPTS